MCCIWPMMNNDRQYNGLQLISPPPEESLRRSSVFSPALNSKRKRSQAPPGEPQPLTPNPRSRKQPKQRGDTPASPSPLKSKRVVVQSPHAHNPNADYIPPTTLILSGAETKPINKPLSRRSRSTSATPIPPYEPPTDIFTPPKEVFVTPITATIKVSKSSKRKSTTKKKKPTPPPIVVKLEMPDVDLNAPMPPPSPGDDPLLLSSSIEPPSSTPTKTCTRSPWVTFSESDALPMSRGADGVPLRRTVSPTPLPFHKLRFDDLPPSSPPDENLGRDQPSPIVEDEDLDITPPDMPFFGLGNNPNEESWSDSGDDLPMLPPPEGSPTKEGEGEFTGRFLEVLVKTKADPPSSATKGRMDEWGNPKSPFPLSLEKSPFPLPREKRMADLDVLKEAEEREDEDREEEEEVRRMSVEPEHRSSDPFDFSGIESLPDDSQERMSVEHFPVEVLQHEDLPGGVPLQVEGEGSPGSRTPRTTAIDIEQDVQEGPSAEDAFRLMGNKPFNEGVGVPSEEGLLCDLQCPAGDNYEKAQIMTDQDQSSPSLEGAFISNPLALAGDESELALAPFQSVETEIDIEIEQDHDLSDEDPSSSSDTSASPDVVKITSADPRAAARAAAILKQHNYDCFTKREMKKRYSDISRRRTMSPGSLVSARGVMSGGIEKQKGKERERRRTTGGMMGVRGEKVYIPGSPATTLPKLLREAEAEVSLSLSSISMSVDQSAGSPNPFVLRSFSKDKVDLYKTPLPTRVFSPVLPQTQSVAEGSMSALINKMNSTLLLTPKVPMTPGEMCYDPLSGERMWTKEEWKRLDACFTDERIEVGMKLGLTGDECALNEGMVDGWETWEGMSSVDDVDLDNVIGRFVEWMGGWEEVDGYGPEWSRENLMSRTRALRSKQRKGKVAPPTGLPFSPSTALATMSLVSPSPFDSSFTAIAASTNTGMDMPEFTPIRRIVGPGVLRKRREWASVVDPASSTPNGSTGEFIKPVPRSLLAPRYSHLWEEAIKVSKDLPQVAKSSEDVSSVAEVNRDHEMEHETSNHMLEEEMELGQESEESGTTPTLVEEEEQSLASESSEEALEEEGDAEVEGELEQEPEQEPEQDQPTTMGKRVKGIIFSYLPTLRRTPSTKSTSTNNTNDKRRKLRSRPSGRPGLPLPPKELLSKPRGPVVTPAREPMPKPVHPKELVHLQQAPPIQPPSSKVSRVVHPKQLVELHHVTPKVLREEDEMLRRRRRQRRSSGASVKDLVKGFEQMEKEKEKEAAMGGLNDGKREVRRIKSIGEWRKDVSGATGKSSGEAGRPVWKP